MPLTSDSLPPAPPIDAASLLERCMDDPEFVCRLLNKVSVQLDTLMAQADAAAASLDFVQLSRAAHSLKGTAGNLSADALCTDAVHLEEASKSSDINTVRHVLTDLHEHANQCSAFVPELIARLKGTSTVGVG